MVTFENLYYSLIPPGKDSMQTDDDFGYSVLVDSSIVAAGAVTNVQFRTAGGLSGTLSCCRWDNLATMTAESTAAGLLSAANHTYWSISASAAPDAMTSETVTQSSANVTGNIIGLVLTGGGSTVTGLRRSDTDLVGYTEYKSNAGSTAGHTRTPTFTISTDTPGPTTGTRLPPPPIRLTL